MKPIHRAIIFVHYDKDNIVDEYVYLYLKALMKNASHIVFVSTSKISEDDIMRVSELCTEVILRENIGYDFMSYKVGLASFEHHHYDEIVICNDSVYGPFYPLDQMFETMQNSQCDFWGITDNTDMGYHLQSYFIVFRQSVLCSKAFIDFWSNIKILSNKEDIIEQYEVGLTTQLTKNKFIPAAYVDFKITTIEKISIVLKKLTPLNIFNKLKSIVSKEYPLHRIGKINPTLYFWKKLILQTKMPFIKIQMLRENPNNINIDDVEEVLQQVSDYDTGVIQNHLSRMKEHQ